MRIWKVDTCLYHAPRTQGSFFSFIAEIRGSWGSDGRFWGHIVTVLRAILKRPGELRSPMLCEGGFLDWCESGVQLAYNRTIDVTREFSYLVTIDATFRGDGDRDP